LQKTSSRIARIAWLLAAAVSLFAIENIWLDPRVASRFHHRLPSLVPEPLGGAWSLVLLGFVLALTLAVTCVVLAIRDATFARWKKALTAVAVLAAALLAGDWVIATAGFAVFSQTSAPHQQPAPRHDHTVDLTWKPSTSANVRYNIYRGTTPGIHPDKLNATPVDALIFTDTTPENGRVYYYVTRAIDAAGRESPDSNEASAQLPAK